MKKLGRFFWQLETEGYTVKDGHVRAIDGEAPEEHKEKTHLATTVRSFPELEPGTLIRHIEESDAAAQEGLWHSAANEARSFFEGIVVEIAKAEAKKRGVEVPVGPKQGPFAPHRQFLRKEGVIEDKEDAFLGAVYSLASTTGSHAGPTDERIAKLVRRVCWGRDDRRVSISPWGEDSSTMEFRSHRVPRKVIAFLHDLTMAAVSFVLALALRLGVVGVPSDSENHSLALVLFTLVCGVVFWTTGLCQRIWRYSSLNDMLAIVRAITLALLISKKPTLISRPRGAISGSSRARRSMKACRASCNGTGNTIRSEQGP